MLYRQFYQWTEPEVFTVYNIMSLIRPHLEYAAPVWSLELTKDINKLENAQKNLHYEYALIRKAPIFNNPDD